MFQLGSLVVLCGLIFGTSGSLLSNLGSAVNNLNILGSLPEMILNSVSGAFPENLNLDVESLQKTTSWPSAKDNILGALNGLDFSKLNPISSQNKLGLRIDELKILDLQASPSPDGQGINLKLPVSLKAAVDLPIGSTLDIALSMDLISSLTVQSNPETGVSMVNIEQCSMGTDKISISLLGRQISLTHTILDGATSHLIDMLSSLLENQICPLVEYILSLLNANILQDLISNQLTGQSSVAI
ncbi:BPI fold-containing family A member 2-like [Meriones unguiculatus]|uniref:BPI fold-containing family A member 2-like n=1 Tax=Meriones unguiculatus TaxID=10047 RepID=UPI00293E88F5|nr:BPI fold-containing family A member 2-like [Meriones unguiculatus]